MLPTIRGVIDRRILLNYRVDPDELAGVLPEPFRPHTVDGHGVGGVCLIRLLDVRPRGLPAGLGTRSENAAHRIAVEWDGDDGVQRGVYVPRRDTDSWLNALLGGRVFPGIHDHATFEVDERDGRYDVTVRSEGETHVHVAGEPTEALPAGSVFDTVSDASSFFEEESLGYSPTGDGFEGVELHTFEWDVTPLAVESAAARYFESFSEAAVTFDHALLMRDIDHEWREGESVCAPEATA